MVVRFLAAWMKLLILTFVYFTAFALLCGCWGVSVSDASNRCVPPDYPALQQVQRRSGQIYTNDTTDSAEKVQAMYSTKLQPAPWQGPFGEKLWRRKAIGNGALYECFFNADHYHTEVGCVYVQQVKDKTQVQVVWEFAEGGSGCNSILGVSATK